MLYSVTITYEIDGESHTLTQDSRSRETLEDRAKGFLNSPCLKVISITFKEEKL